MIDIIAGLLYSMNDLKKFYDLLGERPVIVFRAKNHYCFVAVNKVTMRGGTDCDEKTHWAIFG
jgi:hypothetical protein